MKRDLLRFLLMAAMLSGCAKSVTLYTAKQSDEIGLTISQQDQHRDIKNGEIYPFTGSKCRMTLLVPDSLGKTTWNISNTLGTALLVSKGISVENISGLRPGSSRAPDREEEYTSFTPDPYQSYFMYKQNVDTLYRTDEHSVVEFDIEVNFDRDSIIYFTVLNDILNDSGSSLIFGLYCSEYDSIAPMVTTEKERVEQVFQEYFPEETDTIDISFSLDAIVTEQGYVATLSASRIIRDLGYEKHVHVSDTTEPHEPLEKGTLSTFTFNSVPLYDTLWYCLSHYSDSDTYTVDYESKGPAERILAELNQISRCTLVPGHSYIFKRGDTYYRLETSCPDWDL